jgi:predicted nucleic acid-binding protein
MDLGRDSDDVVDALATIGRRLPSASFVIPPTPQAELLHIARYANSIAERKTALCGIRAARRWDIVPVNLTPVAHGIVSRIAERLRERDLLPGEEVNDSLLVAEASLLETRLLLSSDEHLRGMDFPRLCLALGEFDLAAPVIATPADVVRRFFLR